MNPEQHSYQTIIEYDLEPEIYSFRVLELFMKPYKNQGMIKISDSHQTGNRNAPSWF